MKKYLLITIIVLLLIPAVEFTLELFEPWHLDGSMEWSPDTEFTVKKWFNKEYQDVKEKYLNEHFGFREFFVRLNNEINYDLYNRISAKLVVVGKDNYMFEKNYIRAHFGQDFIGESEVKIKCEKIKFLQDTMAKIGKTLLIVIAPNKADFFPEYIPDSLIVPQSVTNYQRYTQVMDSMGIYHIDFNRFFLENKNKSEYPLYPKHGIHWSQYAAVKAGDSIIRFLEKKNNWDMPNVVIDRIEYKDTINEVDYDIAAGLNLLRKFPHPKMAYPIIHFEKGKQFKKPTGTVIADSYYWNLYNAGFSDYCFTNGKFIYYYKSIYPDCIYDGADIDKSKLPEYLKQNEVFIILATPMHLTYLGYDFIEDIYPLYHDVRRDPEFMKKVMDLKNYIRSSPEWMSAIREKAKQKGLSEDSMMVEDAIYVLERDQNRK